MALWNKCQEAWHCGPWTQAECSLPFASSQRNTKYSAPEELQIGDGEATAKTNLKQLSVFPINKPLLSEGGLHSGIKQYIE